MSRRRAQKCPWDECFCDKHGTAYVYTKEPRGGETGSDFLNYINGYVTKSTHCIEQPREPVPDEPQHYQRPKATQVHKQTQARQAPLPSTGKR